MILQDIIAVISGVYLAFVLIPAWIVAFNWAIDQWKHKFYLDNQDDSLPW